MKHYLTNFPSQLLLLLCCLVRKTRCFMAHTDRTKKSSALSSSVGDISVLVADNQLAADMFSSGLLAGVGDAIAQRQEKHVGNPVDWQRCQQFVLKGFGSGLLWSNWFAVSDQWCTALSTTLALNAVPTGTTYMVASIALEQFLWCPIVYSCWDISFPALLRGSPLEELPRQIRQKIRGLLLANAKVWTLVNVVVYSIPLEWRVILTTIVDLFWQGYVSKTVSTNAETKDAPSAIARNVKAKQTEEGQLAAMLKK